MKYKGNSAGFTFIELLVVFSITAVLSTLGIASFLSYSRAQDLRNASYDLSTLLNSAKSSAQAQVKPADKCLTTDMLNAYKVYVCCVGGGCPACVNSSDNMELVVSCGNKPDQVVSSKQFPNGVSVNTGAGQTTSRSFSFMPLNGGVTGVGKVVLQGYNSQTKTVTVTSAGVIQ